ncbi:hypothetical protein FJY94_01480 [Candidatus Kaiserbacteria bacterium]|nr:hypothetical protein [Candidatus Kaiserbacteria bacterium]
MKKKHRSAMQPPNLAAKALADPRFRKRVVRDKKKYSRTGRTPRDCYLGDFCVAEKRRGPNGAAQFVTGIRRDCLRRAALRSFSAYPRTRTRCACGSRRKTRRIPSAAHAVCVREAWHGGADS